MCNVTGLCVKSFLSGFISNKLPEWVHQAMVVSDVVRQQLCICDLAELVLSDG